MFVIPIACKSVLLQINHHQAPRTMSKAPVLRKDARVVQKEKRQTIDWEKAFVNDLKRQFKGTEPPRTG